MAEVRILLSGSAPRALTSRTLQKWQVRIYSGSEFLDRRIGRTGETASFGLPEGSFTAKTYAYADMLDQDLLPAKLEWNLFALLVPPVTPTAVVGRLVGRILARFVPDALLVDTSEFEVGLESLDLSVSCDGSTSAARSVVRGAALYTYVAATGLLCIAAAMIWNLANLSGGWRVVLGGVAGIGGVGFGLATNLAALANLREPKSEAPVHGRGDIAFAVVGDVLTSLAMLAVAAAGMTCALMGLQDWGLRLDATAASPLSRERVLEGLLWHVTDTLPLVDPLKAWNWTEPWKVQLGSGWTWAGGLAPFLLQAIVAVGFARLVTRVVTGK